MASERGPEIFISYAREDLVRARQLAGALAELGWVVFWDRTIPAGSTWREYIGQKLQAARCVVVAWSSSSVDSHWVVEEAEEAERREALVPVLLEPVLPPLGLRSVQAADLSSWTGNVEAPEFRQFVRDLARHLGLPPREPRPEAGEAVASTTGQRAAGDREGRPLGAVVAFLRSGPAIAAAAALLVGVVLFAWLSPRRSELWEVDPLRVRYLTLEGHALSLFVRGELEPRLEEMLGKSPVIARNEVFRTLEEIHGKFAYARGPYAYFTDPGRDLSEELQERLREVPLCPGTISFPSYLDLPVSPASLIQRGWSVRLKKSPYRKDNGSPLRLLLEERSIGWDQIELQKLLSREEALELELVPLPERKYFEWLTREVDPEDLFFARAFQWGCGGSLVAELEPLRLQLRVLILENLLAAPAKLTGLAVDIDDREALRTEFQAQGEETLPQMIAGDYLDPRESAIVPVRLFISDDDSGKSPQASDFGDPVALDPEEIRQLESIPGEIEFKGPDALVPGSELARALRAPRPAARQSYLVGPALEARSVDVNGRIFHIRQVEMASMSMSHGYLVGSCPYVYAITASERREHLGTLLTGLDAREKRGWYYKDLPPDTRSVLVVERDPEVTFLDALRISAEVGARELLILPQDEALRYDDGVVRILEQGQSLAADFPVPLGITPTRLRLEAFGHYEPLAEAVLTDELLARP